MSSIEERREARRRRRQQQEEEFNEDEDEDEEAAASEVSAVNGEDDLERRRRERREARLRQAAEPQEEERSSRRSRRQQEEETPAEDTSSYRSSRRRRGQEEEEETPAPAAEEPQVEDTSSSQQEAEDESAAQAAREEAERRRKEQEAEEAREAEEAERRREQEAARKREEEKRRQREEEEEQRRQLGEDDGNSFLGDLLEPVHDFHRQAKSAELGKWQSTCLDLSEISEKDESYSLSFEDEDSCVEDIVEDGVAELDEEMVEEGFEGQINQMFTPRAGLTMDDGGGMMTQEYAEEEMGRNDKDEFEEGDSGGGNTAFVNSGIIPHDTAHSAGCIEYETDTPISDLQVERICDDALEQFSSEHLIDEHTSGTYCIEENQKLHADAIPFNWSIIENALSPSLSGTYILENNLEQRDMGNLHTDGLNGDNMNGCWGKTDVSPDASLDAASADRHLDWTSEDYLSDTSDSSHSREMQGLMDEYKKLVNEESEEELYPDLKTELAEAIADDDILGGDGIKDEFEMNSSQHSDDIHEQFAFDSHYDGERECCQSQNSSYKDYCISVFDSSAEYDRSPVQIESPRTLKADDEINSESPMTVPRLTLPSDLGGSSTLTSSERKEITDDQNSAKFASSCSVFSETPVGVHDAVKHFVSDAVRGFIDDAASTQEETGNGYLSHMTNFPLGRHQDAFHCQDLIYPGSPQQPFQLEHGSVGDFQGIDELPGPTGEHESSAPEFDEDILPRIADEELENEELGEDVLFFIPGTMEAIDEAPIHDIHEARDQNYSISSDEQLMPENTTGHASEDKETARELYQENHESLKDLVKQGCLMTEEFTMFYMGNKASINNNSDKVPDVNEYHGNENITFTPVLPRQMPEVSHTGPVHSTGSSSSSRSCDGSQTKSQPLSFQSVLLEISKRGKEMKESITYGLKKHSEPKYNKDNEETVTPSTQEKPCGASDIVPQSKADQAQMKYDVPPRLHSSQNGTGMDTFKVSASCTLGNFVKQISKEEDTSSVLAKSTLSDSENSPRSELATVSGLNKIGHKSLSEDLNSGEAKVENVMSSKGTFPPVLSSWKATRAAAALAEDEDVIAHKNPVINQAFGKVVSQLKDQKGTTQKKRKVYSKMQEELCVSQLTEHFAQVKIMVKPGIKVNESQDQQLSRDQNGSQVHSSEEAVEGSTLSSLQIELQELANMHIVSGNSLEDVSVRPKDPRKMLESFFTNLVLNQAQECKQVKITDRGKTPGTVMKTEEEDTPERHRSVAERVSMFQKVVSSSQKTDTNGKVMGSSSVKQSLSNLLNDLKSKGKTATLEPKPMTVTKATESYQEPKSNFFRQRLLSLKKKEHEPETESVNGKDSSATSEVERKLANLLNSMSNPSSPRKASDANVPPVHNYTKNYGVTETTDTDESTTESPRTFFENFLKQRPLKTKNEETTAVNDKTSGNSLPQQTEPCAKEPNLKLHSQYTSKTSISLKPQTFADKDEQTVCKEQTTVNRVSKSFPCHVTDAASTQVKCQANVLPKVPAHTTKCVPDRSNDTHNVKYASDRSNDTHSTKHVPDRSIETHRNQTHRIKQAVNPQSLNVRSVEFRQTDVCDGKAVDSVRTAVQDPPVKECASSSNIPQTSSQLGPIPQITSYLKVKSFQMLAQSFDEEIGNLSFSEENGDLHLNLSDLTEPCCAQSTPRFFRNSSTFFNLTPRSDGEDEFISPRVSNNVPKAWGPDGPRDIIVTVKPSVPCTDLSMNEEKRMEEERLERERQEKEEAARRKEEEDKKKKGKRKGLGGLSPEKKKLLKRLIMQKAAEDLRNEAKKKAEEKEQYINERVPILKTEGMNQADLTGLCKTLHDKVCLLEEEVYDWEVKIRKQDFEINELTLKVNDTKGKFIKPVLRKVNKTESKLAKLDKKESRDFRSNLKSTGQNKFALDEKEEAKTPDWRQSLKGKGEGEGEEAPAES